MKVMKGELGMEWGVEGREVERLQNALGDLTAKASRLKSGVEEVIECGICNELLRNVILCL